jgi:hypothetical protein
MKTILAALVALMLVSGTAWAQELGPNYYRATNTTTVGKKIVLNTAFLVNPTPRYNVYAISDESKFYITGWRYTGGVWAKVFPQGTFVNAVTDTAVLWHMNVALPISQKVDVLYVRSVTSGASVDLVVYQ